MDKIKISNVYVIEEELKNILRNLKKDTAGDIYEISNKLRETFFDIPKGNDICTEIKNYSQQFVDLNSSTRALIEDLDTFIQNADIIPEDWM